MHAIDLPGFGGSSKPAAASYSARWFSEVVIDLLDSLEIDRAHLVGNSMGGRVALEIGLSAPERVDGLALLCPAVAFVKRGFHPVVRVLRPELGFLPHRFSRATVAGQLSSMFCDPDALDPSVADIAVDEFQRIYGSPHARMAFLKSARNIYLDRPFGRGGFYPRLAELSRPALFVWGTHDPLIPPGFRRHVASWLPGAEQIMLEGVGHVPQIERPEQTNGLLRRFFARRTRSATFAGASGRVRPTLSGMADAQRRGEASRNGHSANGSIEEPAHEEAGQATGLASLAGGLLGGLVRASRRRSRSGSPSPTSTSATPTSSASGCRSSGCCQPSTSAARSAAWATSPRTGPVLLVGNHSGGNLTPDTHVFTLAFSAYFGVERRFHQLAHNLVLSMPGLRILRKFGTVAASRENMTKALESGAALLVYPGGDYEVHRPSWERNKVDFGGRKGFIREALEHDVPIVPVVSIGGQETALFLSRGERLAKLLMLDKSLRLKVLPISIALPWGLNVGDMFGHIPLPAKITIEVLPPIHLREEFGQDPDLDEVYDHVIRLMQETLDALAAERRFPVIG